MSQYNFRDEVALLCIRRDIQVEDIEELFVQGIAMIFILNEKKNRNRSKNHEWQTINR